MVPPNSPTGKALEEGFKGGVEAAHGFEDQGEDMLSYGPCESGSDIHRVGVEITLETPVPVGFAV